MESKEVRNTATKALEEIRSMPDKAPKAATVEKERITMAGPQVEVAPDYSFIPEFVTLHDGTEKRVALFKNVLGRWRTLTPDGEAMYYWATDNNFTTHLKDGFRWVMYKDLFEDTGLFDKALDGKVRNGDWYLMKVPLSTLEVLIARRESLQRLHERQPEGDLAAAADAAGTKAFRFRPGAKGDEIEYI